MFGLVLTAAVNFEEIYTAVKIRRLDTIKVVTGWGLNWNDSVDGNRRALVSSLVPNIVVRTVAGDPSNPSAATFPIVDDVIAEITPWYAVKRDIIIELGNEPNILPYEGTELQDFVYTYRWYLAESIKRLRYFFPHAKLMSTALQPDKKVDYWYQIFSAPDMNIYNMVDYVGVHAYEHTSFLSPQTNHFAKMITRFKPYQKKLFFSELGIAGTNPNKLDEYRTISHSYPVTYYHYNYYGDIDGNYHV